MVMRAAQHHEEVVRVRMAVTDERPLDLDDHEIVTVELSDRSRIPIVGERGQLLCEIDWLHVETTA